MYMLECTSNVGQNKCLLNNVASYLVEAILGHLLRHSSSRYDVENMSWEERQLQYIPELRETYGQAWGSLKKTWKAFYIARNQGDGEKCIKLLERIQEIREAMGLEDEGTYF